MRFFRQAVLLLFLGCCTGKDISVSDGIRNLESTERIIGGKVARHGAFPWMASLHAEHPTQPLDHVCGGAILNEDWIVTAAHCLEGDDPLWKFEVIVGMHNRATKHSPSLRRHNVSKFIVHPDFDGTTFQNDIALLKMTKPIDMEGSNGYVSPIKLPKPGTDPNGYAKVIGWGHTMEDGELSDKLLEVTIPIIPRDLCNESYDEDETDDVDAVTEDMICAGYVRKDSCQNDSGGPLFQTKGGVSTLIGIVSWGSGCGEKYFPGIYTKVSSYVDWVKDAMKNN